MPTSDFYRQHSDDGNLGGPGGINDRPTFYFYIDARSYNSGDSVCNNTIISGNVIQAWAEKDLRSINVGDYIYEIPPYENASFAGNNKWYNLYEPGTSARKIVQITNSGRVNALHTCTRIPPPPPDPVEDPIPPIIPEIPSPTSDLIYKYFVLENLSRSKKIFAYYSGSQNFNYTFSTTTSSADPGAGFFRLNSGSEGSDGTTNENQSTEMYIDIKDNQGEEDIITYLTSLSSSLSNAGTPETPYGEVQLYISGSGADQYYHRFNLQNVTFEGSTPAVNGYFKLDIITEGSDPGSNPLSSSIAAGSGSNVEVRFFNDIIPGYHETEVTSLDKDYVVACITQTASYGSGSISQPFAISWGMPENEFLNSDFYPTQPGYAWLWNDGYKVKHIKINNQSFGGDNLTDFVKKSDWSRFVLYNPFNAQGNLLHQADGNYPETFYLHNVSKYRRYTHLFVNQENRDTTFAVDSQNFASTNHNFLAEGKYIVDAKASGTVIEPTIKTNISESIPQGYFPSGSSNYPTEQFFRGWVDANYYSNGTLVGTGGNYNDPLRQFETGSTERDYDAAPSYIRSTLPFFINATSSYIPISSSDFGTYTAQPNTIRVGPGLRTTGGDVLAYYYEETTGKILISGAEHLDTKKTENYIFNNLYDIELVSPSNETTRYFTPDNLFSIEVKPSQSLWLSRGRDTSTSGDTDRYKYNRYLHRPYKAYVLLGTGSTDAGYGEEDFASAIYGSGSVPVGPPVNEAVQIFMNYSQSAANLRSDGIYTFDTLLSEDVGLTASVDLSYRSDTYVPPTIYGQSEYGDNNSEYGGAGSGTNILTWRTASLNIYKNSSILASETIYLEPTDIEAGSTITVKYPLLQNQISTGDTLRLALEVDTTDTQPFNAALIATSYTMSIEGTVPPTDDKVPVTFNNYLELNDDCDPLVANIVNDRPNARLQDVDYSSATNGSYYPVNFDQIIRNEAVRATVPESNYTQLGFLNQRYLGSSTTREKINEYNDQSIYDQENKFYYQEDVTDPDNINKGKGPKLGKVPNVELKNSYISYFNRIIDPYPLLNNKTAYYVKYLIDESGTIFDPTLSDNNFSIFEKTFQIYDYDQKPTRVKTSLQNINEVKELSKLNEGISPTFKLGQYPVPILYSQTSSLGHTNNIILSGSPFFGTLGIGADFSNYGLRSSTIQPAYPEPPSRTQYTDLSPETFEAIGGGDITLFDGNESVVTSSVVDGAILMPNDSNAEVPNTPGSPLSDTYHINASNTFYTSTLPALFQTYTPSHWTKRRVEKLPSLEIDVNFYQKPPTSTDTANSYQKSTTNISQNDISLTLTIILDAGGSNEQEYVVAIPRNPIGYSPQWTLRYGQGVRITPHSLVIEDAIANAVFNGESTRGNSSLRSKSLFKELVCGGWGDDDGDKRLNGGYGTKVVHYKWTLNYVVKNLKQGSGFRSSVLGRFISNAKGKEESQYKYFKWYSNDLFMMYKGSTTSKDKRSFHSTRTFTPSHSTVDTNPVVKYEVTSPLCSSGQNVNGAPGPFWRKVPNESNMLYMSSSVLNEAYSIYDNEGNKTNSAYYVQAKLPYKGDTNVSFPTTLEPDFIEFDPVQDPWSLEVGDEIRFENNENLVFTITSKDNEPAIINPGDLSSNSIDQKLQVYVVPEIPEEINLDFFVVRRYKENRNFIILDQQMPYGFPITGSLEPSSSPGILLPEHRIEVYNRNPDEVLKDLIEKRII